MHQIILKEICKSFWVREKGERFLGLLGRREKEVRALEQVSFRLNPGELVGYIGPNGAGKSTTVKVMSGILRPSSGECRVFGRVPWKERVPTVSRIGVVFGQRSQLWWDVPVSDSFDLLREIYRIPREACRQRTHELTEALQIGGFLKTPVRQLSLGQRMRCEIAAALLHSPDVLFLDEPTIGLDAVTKLSLREFLKHENTQRGVTMILTTHDMADIEALCSRVMVIGHGRLLYDGTLRDLRRVYAPLRCIRATLTQSYSNLSIEGANHIQGEGQEWMVYFDPQRISAQAMLERLAAKLTLQDIAIQEEGIDQMVASMYKEMGL